MTAIRQFSFSAGEISPSLYTRVDTSRYQTGLKTLRNHLVLRSGGSQNRAGTGFVGQARYSLPQTFTGYLSYPNVFSSSKVRLIPFIFNEDQTYVLEFGAFYMAVIQNGSYITDLNTVNVTSISAGTQATVTQTAHGYSEGDVIGFVAPPYSELRSRTFYVSDTTANTYKLRYLDGFYVDSTLFTATGATDTTYKIYTITTPYSADELQNIQFVQSADVITLAHQYHAPAELARLASNHWTLTDITFAPTISAPTSVSNGSVGSGGDKWVVTSIASDTFEESLQSASTESGTTASSGSPISITWTAATGAQEYNIYKIKNGVYGFIGVAASSPFSDTGIAPDTTATPPIARNPFASDGSQSITEITEVFTLSPPITGRAEVRKASHGFSNGDLVYLYNIPGYNLSLNNVLYVVVNKTANTFNLQNLDGSIVHATGDSFGGSMMKIENFPGVVSYYQQRSLFANTLANPESVYASQTGKFHNFTFSTPTQDDDAVTFNLAGRQVNAVKHLVDLSKLLTFTQAGEWTVEGDDAGVLRPGFVNPRQHSYNGASSVPPVVINGSVVFIQGRGSAVRDLSFDFQIDGYRGNDLTIFSNHLFDGFTIIDAAYQQIPHSILWCVRDDGVLLGMTYIKEQQIIGWHHHDFSGEVENICVVPEAQEDVLYLSIKRTINGKEVRYIERMSSRLINDSVSVEDIKILDAFATYDGTNFSGVGQAVSTATLTLSGGTNWDTTESLTLTASSAIFSSAEVGNEYRFTAADESILRLRVVGYTSSTVLTVRAESAVAADLRSVAQSSWIRAVKSVSGLWHLEGESVSVFADGFVAASPNNSAYDLVTVSSGSISLDRPYGLIHVGLPITADLQTLNVDTAQGETITHKLKIVDNVAVTLESSRGVWVGPDEPTGDDPLEGLNEMKIRNTENYSDPVRLVTGTQVAISIRPEWKSTGSIFIRQVDPVPVSILGVAIMGLFPFSRGGA